MDDFRSTPQLCCSTVQMRYIYIRCEDNSVLFHIRAMIALHLIATYRSTVHVTRHDRRETGFNRPIRARMQLE